MSEKLSQNLNMLMSKDRINAEALSRRIGIPASTIKKIRNNNCVNPTLSTLHPLAKYFSLSISQLIGDHPIQLSNAPNIATHVPLISWHDAITWSSIKRDNHTIITTEHSYSENAYALFVEENDWENLIKGTALLIDPAIEIEHRDFVIVYKEGQKIPTLKQILIDDEITYLKPVVPGYHIVAATPEHRYLGVVVEYKKHLKNLASH